MNNKIINILKSCMYLDLGLKNNSNRILGSGFK